MPQALTGQLVPGMIMSDGWVVRVTAIDTSGALVAGVVVSSVSLAVDDLSVSLSTSDNTPLPLLVPTSV